MTTPLPRLDDALLDCLVPIVREHGPIDLPGLARRARLRAQRPDLHEVAVEVLVDTATVLVTRPDGRISYLGDVLDGIVLTHRVRGSLDARTDLWLGPGVQPFLTMACLGPLPLATGGEARLTDTADHPVLLGPTGWLPPAERGDLIALTWREDRLGVRLVDPAELAGPAAEDAVRRALSERIRAERWWREVDDGVDDGGADWARRAMLVHALGVARLEDPDLLSTPHQPLDDLLYDPLGATEHPGWRELAAWRQEVCVSFVVQGMPDALDRELRHRARRYGMDYDQFLVAVLGHLAWRTPFAEDLRPSEDWVSERSPRPSAPVSHLRAADPPVERGPVPGAPA